MRTAAPSRLAAGASLTLTGALRWLGETAGPGTIETDGTTTIHSPAFVDGGVTWVNSGTVLDGAAIDDDAKATTSTLPNSFVNTATGTFDVTAAGYQAFIDISNGTPTSFSNAGLLEKTAGAGTASVWATIENTGTIAATAGTLDSTRAARWTARSAAPAAAWCSSAPPRPSSPPAH